MFDLQGFFSPLSKIGISYKVKKDFYHDVCHNKSLAISFDTDTV